MTLDKYGHLFNDDLAEVAKVLGQKIESAAVSLRHLWESDDEKR
jgi:hypothetical protein